jgi:hypothetical protein
LKRYKKTKLANAKERMRRGDMLKAMVREGHAETMQIILIESLRKEMLDRKIFTVEQGLDSLVIVKVDKGKLHNFTQEIRSHHTIDEVSEKNARGILVDIIMSCLGDELV